MTANKNIKSRDDNDDEQSNPVEDSDTAAASDDVIGYLHESGVQFLARNGQESVDNRKPVPSILMDLSNEVISEILSDDRYQLIIKHLAAFKSGEDSSNGISMGSLVDRVAADELDISQSELTAANRQRIWVSLYETHLPLLGEAGIVEWESKWHCIIPK